MTRGGIHAALGAAFVALLIAPAVAGADRRATSAERNAIAEAIRTTDVGGFGEAPTNQYRLTGVRVTTLPSRRSGAWATATATPRRRYRDTFQTFSVIAVKPGGTREWVVVDGGTADVGCGIAADVVVRDLTSENCPSDDDIPTTGGGSRPAGRRQASALTRAVRSSPVGGLDEVPRANYRVVDQKISSLSRNWAYASLRATPAARNTFQDGYVFAVLPAGTRSWVVIDAGSAAVSCGIAPNAVIAGLLAASPQGICPRGEGIRGS
jgi:hypothetical protein